ncbi:MAG: SMP-30/gluconolactonase/LRE family protein [SAR324 cluster bacterium]|nr:SMP-30/gluconolactonase/LRE family protein [SAR324 cluster bacterium]
MTWKFELLSKHSGDITEGTGWDGDITEGPVWDGEYLFFTRIRASKIFRYDPKNREITEARSGTNFTNGLAYDQKGRLFGCCAAGRSIVRFDPGGNMVKVIDRFDGKKFNTPSDLAIDLKDRIWFTNPWSEPIIDPKEQRELDHQSVLRADPNPDGSYSVTRVTFDTTMPNGILVSRDQQTLYVAESGYSQDLNRELRAYPIKDDGSLGPYRTLHSFGKDAETVQRGIDGMCLDAEGNIVATAGWELSGPGPMIYVFSPEGRVLETHPVPALRPSNCCFGGPDLTTLFVTSVQGHLFCTETDRVGWAIYP